MHVESSSLGSPLLRQESSVSSDKGSPIGRFVEKFSQLFKRSELPSRAVSQGSLDGSFSFPSSISFKEELGLDSLQEERVAVSSDANVVLEGLCTCLETGSALPAELLAQLEKFDIDSNIRNACERNPNLMNKCRLLGAFANELVSNPAHSPDKWTPEKRRQGQLQAQTAEDRVSCLFRKEQNLLELGVNRSRINGRTDSPKLMTLLEVRNQVAELKKSLLN